MANCADCGQPIHRAAPGAGYQWAHNRVEDLWNCPGTDKMTQPEPTDLDETRP